VNAPVLTDCPVNIECSAVESIMPGSNELFIGKVEAVHVDEEYLDKNGNILWNKMNLILKGSDDNENRIN
jgi:flavin reductase (DIM6/NTAB) family NADH-FMN oxidoreductase RutF